MSVVDFNVPGAGVPADPSFLPAVPQEILDRHGARVLHPASAPAAPGQRDPQPTVYRAGTLLIPEDVRGHANFDRIRAALLDYGVEVTEPPAAGDRADGRPVTRCVALPVATGKPEAVIADAWAALQHLKAVAAAGRVDGEEPVDPELVAKIAPEHVYFTSAPWNWTGAPHEGSARPPSGGHHRRETGRRPVAVVAAKPRCDTTLARRPVIAVLDTGLGPHPWFGMPDRKTEPTGDSGIKLWPDLQAKIHEEEKHAGWSMGVELLDDWRDTPTSTDALLGEIGSETGHGTFIAGIIRQAEPDADVLSVRVMHSDGIAYESDVLQALTAIADRVREACDTRDPEKLVDIVSLSMGYFDQHDHAEDPGHPLKAVLTELAELGVLVVAAAGNHGTTRPFYPAAFAVEEFDGRPLVISVGALNTNGSKAMFSNFGCWVRNWATGVGVISTYPTDIRGPRQPSVLITAQNRATNDEDDFTNGFAAWDGTSFAAPLAAAKLATALLAGSAGKTAPSLADATAEAHAGRARAAWKKAVADSAEARACRAGSRRGEPGDSGGFPDEK